MIGADHENQRAEHPQGNREKIVRGAIHADVTIDVDGVEITARTTYAAIKADNVPVGGMNRFRIR